MLRNVRANPLTALVPVIMLTSSSEQSDIVACYQSGANSFIRKPVDFGEFTEKLNCLQAYWLGVNEPLRLVDGFLVCQALVVSVARLSPCPPGHCGCLTT